MRDLAVLLMHLLATVARLAGPGGARSVVAESVLVNSPGLKSVTADAPASPSWSVYYNAAHVDGHTRNGPTAVVDRHL